MWVSRYVIWLVIFSVFGWIYESAYCTIKDKRWENRGFLYGPLCPIYGTGAVLIFAAWSHVLASGSEPSPVAVFLVVALGSAVLEYGTSWLLEVLFHARWWDYHDMPLNLNGRICLPATTLFGVAGVVAVYVVYEPVVAFTNEFDPAMLEAVSLVLVALVSADATLTVSALTRFSQAAAAVEKSVNAHMERFVREAQMRGSSAVAAFADERERFAASLRASRVGEMSLAVRSAASRVRMPRPPEGMGEVTRLWSELRKRRA